MSSKKFSKNSKGNRSEAAQSLKKSKPETKQLSMKDLEELGLSVERESKSFWSISSFYKEDKIPCSSPMYFSTFIDLVNNLNEICSSHSLDKEKKNVLVKKLVEIKKKSETEGTIIFEDEDWFFEVKTGIHTPVSGITDEAKDVEDLPGDEDPSYVEP